MVLSLAQECRQCGIEHPPPIGDLVQLEIRDVVDLDDNCTGFDDAGLYRRNVPAQERQILHDPRTFPGKIEKPTDVDEVHRRVMEIAGDPLPYGIAPNRRVIDELIRHALTQRIITKPVTVEELFAPGTQDLMA